MNVAQKIATALQAKENCRKNGNDAWYDNWSTVLEDIESNWLPSGSGFDAGTTIEQHKCKLDRIVLATSYHHMNEHGYTKWTEHEVWVVPTFAGFDVIVKGQNYNNIKDYILQTFYDALIEEVEQKD